MTVRYSFLAIDDDYRLIAEWFEAIEEEKTVDDRSDRTVYFFRSMAKEPLPDAENIDQNKTPLIFIQKPQLRPGKLWTDGEVIVSPVPLKSQFPKLHKISKSFAEWLKGFDLIFTQKVDGPSEWNYYLEGGIQNYDAELYALPRAMEALRSGQYFVHYRDNSARLETLSKNLRLRGYDVENI